MCQPDQPAMYSSAVAAPVSDAHGGAVTQQAAMASSKQHSRASQQVSTPIAGCRQHSPDSSATLTGSGRCSDASDLTSSHPSNLPKHQHKRIKLGSTQPAQHDLAHHASAQCPPDPNLMPDGCNHDAEESQMPSQQGVQSVHHPMRNFQHAATDSQLKGCHVLFQPALSPMSGHRPQDDVLHPIDCNSLPANQHAPAYTRCMISGLTPAEQLLKDKEERELAQQLRHQQDMYTSGYTVDSFGAAQLPAGQYERVISMKQVFAQRWQRNAVTADVMPSMKFLLTEAVELAPTAAPVHQSTEVRLQENSMQSLQDPGQTDASRHNGKMPVRLSNLKNAMRKAELSGAEMSSSMTSSNVASCGPNDWHTAWQVGQLCNTPQLNDAWVEYYVDRFNTEFDNSYWSMLELLSASAQ